MTKVISSTELHRRTREMLERVREEGEAVVVETYGRPVAVILPYEAYLASKQKAEVRSTYPFPPTTLEEVAGCLASAGKVRTVEEMEDDLQRRIKEEWDDRRRYECGRPFPADR